MGISFYWDKTRKEIGEHMQDLKQHLSTISEIKSRLVSLNGKLIFLTVSGSHLYGFPSKDSDIDYRGTFVVGTSHLLGLGRPTEAIELNSGNNDIVLNELSKEIGLAIKGNCNIIEHINAQPILTTAEFLRLRQLVNNAFGKNGLYNSYKGMATFNYKKFILQGRNTVKKYLYVFRGLLAGIYVLETGIVKPSIVELNKYFGIKEIDDLVKLKLAGSENDELPKELDQGNLEQLINQMFDIIDKAYVNSNIPERPTKDEVKALDDFLKNVRMDML
jgi:predicted nucleotidyltransferase